MRIIRISAVNAPGLARGMYAGEEGFALLPYEEQKRRLDEAGVGHGDSFARTMRSIGHEAYEIMVDLKPLQTAWARERGYAAGSDWKPLILLKQLQELKPDAVYFQGILSLSPDFYRGLKRNVPGLKCILAFKGATGTFYELEGIDLCFGATPHLVSQLKSLGAQAQVLYHAFDTTVLERLKGFVGENIPVTFVGSSGYNLGVSFQARYWMLDGILRSIPEARAYLEEREAVSSEVRQRDKRQSGISQWRHSAWNFCHQTLEACPDSALKLMARRGWIPEMLRRVPQQILMERDAAKKNLEAFPSEKVFAHPIRPPRPLRNAYPAQVMPAAHGLEMYRVLRRSQITVNRHGDFVAGECGNMRLFEATGVGACLVTDRGNNLSELFEENKEVVAFSSTEECVEKIRYLMNHPAERSKIAAAGQARTLRDHTIQSRCQTIAETAKTFL